MPILNGDGLRLEVDRGGIRTRARNCTVKPKEHVTAHKVRREARTVVGRDRLEWRGETLHRVRGRAIVQIVCDESHRGMWRVRFPDGRLSDMVERDARQGCGDVDRERDPLRIRGARNAQRGPWVR